MATHALRFHGVGDLRLEEVEPVPPRRGEVRVDVVACGVCGSDLHFLDGSARTGTVPVTLGHEVAGVVALSRHPHWNEGDLVVVAAGLACGTCRPCLDGRSNLCKQLMLIGIDVDGGWADTMVVDGGSLIARPAGLAPEAAAVAADAGATAYHAMARKAGLREGDAAAVIGIGGLGTFAVQVAKLIGAAPIIAIDRDPSALDRARALGADEAILVREDTSVGREVKLLTDGGVDVAAEFVGASATVDAAIKSLRPGGVAVAVGVGTEALVTVPPVLWATHEYELRGSFGSLEGDPERILAWLEDGTLVPPHLERVALGEAAGPILDVAVGRRRAHGRMVVIPGDLA